MTSSDPHSMDSRPVPEAAPSGRSSGLMWTAAVAAYPMLLLTAAWIVVGRALFGAGGLLVTVFLVSVGPLYAVIMGLGVHRMMRASRDAGRRGTTLVIASLQLLAWILALGFGFLVPDRVDGRATSALAEVAGENALGLSAGFGNTFGILTFVFAVWFMIAAWTEDRRTRQQAQGGPVSEDELLDAQGYHGDEVYQPPNYWT